MNSGHLPPTFRIASLLPNLAPRFIAIGGHLFCCILPTRLDRRLSIPDTTYLPIDFWQIYLGDLGSKFSGDCLVYALYFSSMEWPNAQRRTGNRGNGNSSYIGFVAPEKDGRLSPHEAQPSPDWAYVVSWGIPPARAERRRWRWRWRLWSRWFSHGS